MPLIVITSANHDAVNPAGKPVATPIPVASVVVCVISVKAVFTHKVGVLEAKPAVIVAVTIIVPVALTVPQPPVVVTV